MKLARFFDRVEGGAVADGGPGPISITNGLAFAVLDVRGAERFSIAAFNDVTTPSGLTITLRKSNKARVLQPDYVYAAADWTDVAAAVAIAADGYTWFEVGEPAYAAAVCVYAISSGSSLATHYTLVQGLEG